MKKNLTIIITIFLLLVLGGTVLAEGGVITSGDIIETTLAAGTVDIWTFEAIEGDMIIFGAASDEFDSIISFFDSEETLLAEDDDGGNESNALLWGYLIEETGTYTVEVSEYSGTEGGVYTATFFIVNFSGNIEYSDSIQDTLEIGSLDGWDFYGLAGDKIRMSLDSDEFDTYITLLGPQGGIAVENDDVGEGSNALVDGFVLPEEGYYTIMVSSYYFEGLGEYTLNLELLEENVDLLQPVTMGEESIGYLSSGNLSEWIYEGVEGETIAVSVYSDEFDTYLEIFDSEGNLLDSNDDGPNDTNSLIERVVFPEDGVYYFSVSGYNDLDHGLYSITISEPLGGEMYMGEILPGQTATATLEGGYWHGWEFNITDETYVTFSLESDDFDTLLELYGPGGYLTDDDDGFGETNSLISDYLLDEPGTYTIYASGYSSQEAGDYILTYTTGEEEITEYQRGSETQISYNSVSNGILESGNYDAWLFTGIAGDVVSIAVASDVFDPYIELYGPSDELLEMNDDDGTSFNSLIADFTIPADGIYEVTVSGIDFTSSGAYTVSISSESVLVPVVDIEEGINGLLEEATIDYSTTVNDDGSGTFMIIFLIDESDSDDLIDQLEERDLGSGVDDWCDEVEGYFDDMDELPNLDDSSYDESDDGFLCSIVYEFDDFDELEEIYEDFGFVEINDLDFDEENIDYAVDLEEVDTIVQALFADDADIEFLWSVLVSGKLAENNADDTVESKAVWEIDLDDKVELEMIAEKGGIPTIYLIVGAGLLVLLVGGGLGAFFLIKALRSK